ncbi:hypothetical protein HYALB_00007297 [Hymenoscyphus albidus]|uniref:Uncharacterized protein n=1 Tax=Hymenoscyphus albidus TaxID=595503 RepID=A0A9N9M3V8_9HELO|nr:hypothetical protein HYALB_00007297 [Hymenoscyphus albidus]
MSSPASNSSSSSDLVLRVVLQCSISVTPVECSSACPPLQATHAPPKRPLKNPQSAPPNAPTLLSLHAAVSETLLGSIPQVGAGHGLGPGRRTAWDWAAKQSPCLTRLDPDPG